MKEVVLLNQWLCAIKEKVPHGQNVASFLADTLCIGKEAVYRRMRGEVPFTFQEVAVIARKLGISLNAIVGESNSAYIPFYYTKARFGDADEESYRFFSKAIHEIVLLANDPDSELGISSNIILEPFAAKYPYLNRFRSFKWRYQHGGKEQHFREMIIPEHFRKLALEYHHAVKQFKTTYLILDSMIFNYLVNDIKYFENINLIQPDEIKQIKEELFLLLKEMETMAAMGEYDNGNRIYIYISYINFESTYSYTHNSTSSFSSVSIFSLNVIQSVDPVMYQTIKGWIQTLKRLSVLISETGEIPRKQFFRKQRQLLETL